MEESFARKLLTIIDTFIEDFENEKFLEKNKNRSLGIVYTPNQIVDYIISNIFRIYFNNFITSQNQSKFSHNLEQNLRSLCENQKIKEILNKIIKNMRILDPSCGTGRFLISIVERLYKFYKIIDPELSDFNIKKEILQNNLYGIEIENSAYILSKLRLFKWLLSNNIKNVKFKSLNLENIKLTDLNNIIEKSEIKLNIFNSDFLLEFNSDKFDIIIGNPPYVENKKIKNIEYKKKLKNRFKSAYRLFDLSIVFIERSFELLKSTIGCFSMVTTNKFLSADYGVKIRSLLVNNTELKEIINISSIPIFRKTAAYPIILSFKKNEPKEDTLINIKYYDNLNNLLENNRLNSTYISQKSIKKVPSLVFPIFGNINLINYLYTHFLPFIKTFRDLRIYYRPFGFINWAKHFDNLRNFKNSEKDLLLIGTGNIGKYHIKFDKYIKISGKNLKVSYFQFNKDFRKIWEVLKSEKLVFREIAKQLTWVYDPGLFANITGLYFVKITSIDNNTLFCILTIMNSELMDLIFKSLFGTLHMSGGYLRVNGSFIKRLPMPRKFPVFLSELGKILQLLSQLKYDLNSYKSKILNFPELETFKEKSYRDITTYFYFFNKLSNALVNLLYLDELYLKANLNYDILRGLLNSDIESSQIQLKFLLPRFHINSYQVFQLNELKDILIHLEGIYTKFYNNSNLTRQIREITQNILPQKIFLTSSFFEI
ncbi:MAG: Eco57I restriction-modification methylase domain-containing protein [Candidatus Hermodarchaeota archaeon]